MKIGIIGCTGKMGRALLEEIASSSHKFKLIGAVTSNDNPFLGKDIGCLINNVALNIKITSDLTELCKSSDVVIEFTNAKYTLEIAKIAAANNVRLVSGTTGINNEQLEELKEFAKQIPIVWSPNMSITVNLMANILRKVSSILDEDYDIELIEKHHNQKKMHLQALPLLLAEYLAKGRNIDLNNNLIHNRNNIREKGKIGISVVRAGNIFGEHTALFANDHEILEFTHKAQNRNIFAQGALRAAWWVKDKKPGFYTMQEILDVDGVNL